uniref:AF4/FMR2 family member 1 n=1 Tax=Sander lucioperca TaxID=283035 RepID=A0A8C9Z5E0_SANLU
EASQTKELSPENVPLFREPYKVKTHNSRDELSNRIQRMLGSYEDVNNPYPFAIEPLPIPTYVTSSQSDQGQLNTDKPTKPPFHNQVHYMSTQSQKSPSSNGYSSQPMGTFTTSSPNHHGHSSIFSNASLNHSQLSFSAHQQKCEAHSDLRECVSLPQEMSSQSPDTKLPPFPHSSDHDTNDTSLPQANKGNTLPSQTFPSLLSSKQPSVVMTQKPTAYVRPMDGQDQVVSESPELKPSPEPYVSLPELINKSDVGKTKILPQFLEASIFSSHSSYSPPQEMTHSWPPLLTAIHTPKTGVPTKSPFQTKTEYNSGTEQRCTL